MERMPWLNPHYGYQTPPPPPGHFNSPPPLPPGVGPLPDAQSTSFYHSGFQMLPPSVPFHYPPPGFNGMGQNPFPDPAAIWSPVAGMDEGPPGTGWWPSSVTAWEPQNYISPGITPSIKTPDVQEVRQDRVPHPRGERSKDHILVVDNACSTVKEVGSTKLQMSAVADDQEKEKQDRISDYACSTAKEGGVTKRKLQEIISSERIQLEAPFIADFQEGAQAEASNQMQPSPGKAKEKRQQDQMSTMEDAEVRERKLQKLISSESTSEQARGWKQQLLELICLKKIELGASFVAGSQDQGRQEEASPPCQPIIPGQEKTSELCNQLILSSSTPEETIRCGKSQEIVSSIRNELETPVLADFQEAMQAQASNQSQPCPSKAERQEDQTNTIEEDALSTSEGREIREKNQLEDSACNAMRDPIPQMTLSFHDQEDSCSLMSSTLNWASTFDEVSSTGEMYWGTPGVTVKVGDYFVEQKQSATADAIIKKYGDIARDYQSSSTMLRSYAVQGVCVVVEGLQIPLEQLSHDSLKRYVCFVKEGLLMGLKIEWLEDRLDEVSETIDAIKEYKRVRDVQKAKAEKMKGLKEKIGVKNNENSKCENEVEELRCLLQEATLEAKQKKSAIDDIKSRYTALPKGVLQGLY